MLQVAGLLVFAVATISAERPELEVMMVSAGEPMTMDFREDRVRVMVNPDAQGGLGPAIGEVVLPPQIG